MVEPSARSRERIDPFRLTAAELERLIVPGTPNLPELDAARRDIEGLGRAPQTQLTLDRMEAIPSGVAIPQTTLTDYRRFVQTGDRTHYEAAYFLKRARLAAAALRMFLGEPGLKNIVQDYVWSICEETNWVLPAHENNLVDLFSAETAFALAETLALLGDALDAEVRSRVRSEVECRVFDPYLRYHALHWWYRAGMNWNGVCNSSIAAAFLLLEPERGRLARALEIALAGLGAYLDAGFEPDGSSNEGVSYWHYGLINFVAFAEMLRARTGGTVDLLSSDRLRSIAAYPSKLLLSASRFATFSDCDDTLDFNQGILARLAERTGEQSLLNLMASPASGERIWRLTMALRSVLWWDGRYHPVASPADVYLPAGGIVRLVSRVAGDTEVVLIVKAGHNGENHNHNDIGSFIVHVDGETLLTDPGRGLYARDYFNQRRYENVFANSYSHSVPRIDGQLQQTGAEYHGEILAVETDGPAKSVVMELARAYAVPTLASARRRLTLESGGTVVLNDTFRFAGDATEVEQALVTWCPVEVDGATATIRGQRHVLRLEIVAPGDVRFEAEALDQACHANAKPGVLTRLRVSLGPQPDITFEVRIEWARVR